MRRYRPGVDGPAVATVVYRSIQEVARRHYSASQVQAWAPEPTDPSSLDVQACDGRRSFVAVDGAGTVVGFCDLQHDRHIDHLFCAPEVAGTGVGSQMYEHLEATARAAGATRLSVDASETARPLFERHGFRVLARQVHERAGETLHNYRMVKDLG